MGRWSGLPGTELAGAALYGDLAALLSGTQSVVLHHRLENVKLLLPNGDNEPHLWGAITDEAVARAEVAAPNRTR